MHTIRLDLALTRDEIATTIRQLSANLRLDRMLRDPRGLLVGLTIITVMGSIAARAADRRVRNWKNDV